MHISKKLMALGAFFVLAVGIAGCGSGISGNSVASVAGNPITTQAFDHWMYVASKGNAEEEEEEGDSDVPIIVPEDPPGFSGCIAQVRAQIPTYAKTPAKTLRADCKSLFTSLTSQVLGFLIDAYWYQADAHRLGVNMSTAHIDSLFAQEKKSEFKTAAAYNAYLSESGETTADLLFQVRYTTAEKALVAHYTKKVTPAAISAYYNSHASQFGTQETRNVRIVRTNSKSRASAAKAALASGHSWKSVAKQYSIDAATKNDGGLLANVTNGEEEKQLNTAIFSSPLNKVEGPIKTVFGYYIVQVIKITPSTHQSLAKSTATIKELLTEQDSTAATTDLTKAVKKLYGNETLCRSLWSISDCKGYKAPKTKTSSTATAATTS